MAATASGDLALHIRRAVEYQEKLGYTDERFSREILRIDKSYWSKLKRGRATGRGYQIVERLMKLFPDLAFSLPTDVPNGTVSEQGRLA